MTKYLVAAVLALTLIASPDAQSVPQLAWDQGGNTLDTVKAYTFTLLVNKLWPLPLGQAQCSGPASPFLCAVPLDLTMWADGTWQLQVIATTPAGDQSEPSTILVMQVAKGVIVTSYGLTPSGLRIQQP